MGSGWGADCEVRWWNGYSNLLKSTNVHSLEKEEPEDMEEVVLSLGSRLLRLLNNTEAASPQGWMKSLLSSSRFWSSGCCRSVLADTYLKHCMDNGDAASGAEDRGGHLLF